ncbi:MAG: hypothetical protein ABWZ85_09675 [Luteibacter sp.]
MQYELFILRSLLVASLLVCGLIVGNMLTYTGTPVQLANVGPAAAATTSSACALPPDGVVCPRPAA